MKTYPDGVPPTPKDVESWLIEFAKMHVKAAMASVEKKIKPYCSICNSDSEINISNPLIINCYPLHNVE